MNITEAQVEALSPDAASLKRARGLVYPTHWASLGADEHALWGECKGSGKNPYKTQVDLSDMATKCSCPSRKFPCKHALGLMLIAATNEAALSETKPPDWVSDWLTKRAARRAGAEKKPKSKQKTASRKKAAKRRSKKREALAAEGVESLTLWLKDAAHMGLAAMETVPASFWKDQAARMVDCKLPGAARFIEEMAELPGAYPEWPQEMLLRMGRLYLLIEAYQQIDDLPEPAQADVRTLLGWTTKEKDILADEPAVEDDWLVAASYIRDERRKGLRSQWQWLLGRESGRAALILDYAYRTGFQFTLVPGQVYRGALHYYPSAWPLRAAYDQLQPGDDLFIPAGASSLQAFLDGYAGALQKNAWLEQYPAVVQDLVPLKTADGWFLRDKHEQALPISPTFKTHWALMAVSAGHPMPVFVLWDGFGLLPLSAWVEGRCAQLWSPLSD